MPNAPPAFGLPIGFGVAVDNVTLLWAFTAFVMLASLLLLFWALRARDRVSYRLRCPEHRAEAEIVVRLPRGKARLDVLGCSLCNPGGPVTCEKRCLPLVA